VNSLVRSGGLLAAAAALTTLTACGASGPSASIVPLTSVKDYNVVPGQPLGPATQTAEQWNGRSWSFRKPATGKVTLLYFGYTSCPDVCPITMSDLAMAMRELPADVTGKVWVQFVSTDPHRDTPHKLRSWIDEFNPDFHAARAPIDDVITAARAYGIAIQKPKITRGDYEVTHGGDVVVLDQHGGEVGFFNELAPVKDYRAAIPALVEKYA